MWATIWENISLLIFPWKKKAHNSKIKKAISCIDAKKQLITKTNKWKKT